MSTVTTAIKMTRLTVTWGPIMYIKVAPWCNASVTPFGVKTEANSERTNCAGHWGPGDRYHKQPLKTGKKVTTPVAQELVSYATS